jgi:deoxyadenosine/deoxycytidine kinase
MRISIVGNIGSGKSTLLTKLQSDGKSVVFEPVSQWTALSEFYKDQNKWALALQIQILDSFVNNPCNNYNVIVERSPWESLNIFAQYLANKNILCEIEMNILKSINQKIGWEPDVYIYVDTCPKKCMERIKNRGRECEECIDIEYIKELDDLYKDNILSLDMKGYSVYKIDGNKSEDQVFGAVKSIIDYLSKSCQLLFV